MKHITLKHLRYFAAVIEHRHFGRAAEACAVSQPALSLQLKDLEEIMGGPLLERGPRGAALTPLGEDVAARALPILRDVYDLEDLARASGDALTGRLRIGVIPTIAPYLLPRLMAALVQRYPRLEPRPREAITQVIIRELIDAQLDLALVALPISEPALEELPLFEEDFVLVRAADQARRPVPSAADLSTMRLLLLEEGHCFRDQALAFCQASPGAAASLMEGGSLSTLVQMVGAGMGVTLIPEMAIPLESRTAPISIARFDAPRPSRQIGMVWRRSTPLAPRLAEIGEIARRVGQGREG